MLCINISGFHLDSGILHGDRCPVVVGIPSYGGVMVVAGAARACCSVDVRGGAFCCDITPCRIVACAGDARVVSFTWPWDDSVAITGTVSGNNTFSLALETRMS